MEQTREPTANPVTNPELVILDFAGVCLPPDRGPDSSAEATPAPSAIDPGADRLRADAQASGITVAVLSNELDERTITSTPFLAAVDHVVSCNQGIQKPDRRAFQRVMIAAGVDAGRTLVVDDSALNVRGAEAAGAVALHFDVTDRAASWAFARHLLGLDPIVRGR